MQTDSRDRRVCEPMPLTARQPAVRLVQATDSTLEDLPGVVGVDHRLEP